MSELKFHRCRFCGIIFYHQKREAYCIKCVPTYKSGPNMYSRMRLSDLSKLEARRAWDRERWRRRMEDPVFREKERKRSLVRRKEWLKTPENRKKWNDYRKKRYQRQKQKGES